MTEPPLMQPHPRQELAPYLLVIDTILSPHVLMVPGVPVPTRRSDKQAGKLSPSPNMSSTGSHSNARRASVATQKGSPRRTAAPTSADAAISSRLSQEDSLSSAIQQTELSTRACNGAAAAENGTAEVLQTRDTPAGSTTAASSPPTPSRRPCSSSDSGSTNRMSSIISTLTESKGGSSSSPDRGSVPCTTSSSSCGDSGTRHNCHTTADQQLPGPSGTDEMLDVIHLLNSKTPPGSPPEQHCSSNSTSTIPSSSGRCSGEGKDEGGIAQVEHGGGALHMAADLQQQEQQQQQQEGQSDTGQLPEAPDLEGSWALVSTGSDSSANEALSCSLRFGSVREMQEAAWVGYYSYWHGAAVVRVQRLWRAKRERRALRQQREAVIALQSMWRWVVAEVRQIMLAVH